jgi:hypothetical protein
MYLSATSMLFKQLVHFYLLKCLDFVSVTAITKLSILLCHKPVLSTSQSLLSGNAVA